MGRSDTTSLDATVERQNGCVALVSGDKMLFKSVRVIAWDNWSMSRQV